MTQDSQTVKYKYFNTGYCKFEDGALENFLKLFACLCCVKTKPARKDIQEHVDSNHIVEGGQVVCIDTASMKV